ncbi:ATP-dependent DNA helicase RecG, partial [Campylobacter jejuni]
LKEFASTLDGFKIAELDLKNRLSGDLLDGFMQHGNEFKFFDFSKDEEILEKVKKDLAKKLPN